MEESQIGIFKEFWDGNHPHHLPLMNLRDDTTNKNWNIEISLERIEKIFKENDKQKIIQDLELLIGQNNWRPQIVFCISILKLKEEELSNIIMKLWNKLEEYSSWIIPQLAVTASLVDSNFKEKAKEILKNRKQIEKLIKAKKIKTKRLKTRGRCLEIERMKPNETYDNIENLIYSCYWCNNAKTDEFTFEEFLNIGKQIGKIWKTRLNKKEN